MEQYYTVAEAAAKLGISPTACNRLIARGTLGGHLTAGRWFIRRSTVHLLLQDPAYLKRTRRQQAVEDTQGELFRPEEGRAE